MKEKNGYIAIDVAVHQFEAVFKTSYRPMCRYRIKIQFGRNFIIFDPLDGKNDSIRTVEGVIKELKKRMDIANIQQVITDFEYYSSILLKRFKADGLPLTQNEPIPAPSELREAGSDTEVTEKEKKGGNQDPGGKMVS